MTHKLFEARKKKIECAFEVWATKYLPEGKGVAFTAEIVDIPIEVKGMGALLMDTSIEDFFTVKRFRESGVSHQHSVQVCELIHIHLVKKCMWYGDQPNQKKIDTMQDFVNHFRKISKYEQISRIGEMRAQLIAKVIRASGLPVKD